MESFGEYVRVAERLPEHPKVVAIPKRDRDAALGFLLRLYCYASRHETDGFVPTGFVLDADDTRLMRHLVKTGLVDKSRGGWQVHDWLDYNRSKEEIDAIRKVRRAAGQRGGLSKSQAKAKQSASKLLDGGLPFATDMVVAKPYPSTTTSTITPPTPPQGNAPKLTERTVALVSVWEEVVGSVPSARDRETIKAWAEFGCSDAAVRHALGEMVRADARASYATAILRKKRVPAEEGGRWK
jgi:hypothetical protein